MTVRRTERKRTMGVDNAMSREMDVDEFLKYVRILWGSGCREQRPRRATELL